MRQSEKNTWVEETCYYCALALYFSAFLSIHCVKAPCSWKLHSRSVRQVQFLNRNYLCNKLQAFKPVAGAVVKETLSCSTRKNEKKKLNCRSAPLTASSICWTFFVCFFLIFLYLCRRWFTQRLVFLFPLKAHIFLISLCPAQTGGTGGRELGEENDPDLREEVLQKSGAEDQVSGQPGKVNPLHTVLQVFLDIFQLTSVPRESGTRRRAPRSNPMCQLTVCSNQVHGVGAGSERHHPGNARDRHDARFVPPAGGAQRRPLAAGSPQPWKHRYPFFTSPSCIKNDTCVLVLEFEMYRNFSWKKVNVQILIPTYPFAFDIFLFQICIKAKKKIISRL